MLILISHLLYPNSKNNQTILNLLILILDQRIRPADSWELAAGFGNDLQHPRNGELRM